MTYYTFIKTPAGDMLFLGDGAALSGAYFTADRHLPALQPEWVMDSSPFKEVLAQLDEYFAGRRRTFDLPLLWRGTTFQRAVWAELDKIAYGETRTYRQIAAAIGTPRAVRAVGAAVGRNPFPIIIPCHRVIGANGNLTGFAGGLPSKLYLLGLEGALPKRHGQTND